MAMLLSGARPHAADYPPHDPGLRLRPGRAVPSRPPARGVYPLTAIAADVSEERLARFFVKDRAATRCAGNCARPSSSPNTTCSRTRRSRAWTSRAAATCSSTWTARRRTARWRSSTSPSSRTGCCFLGSGESVLRGTRRLFTVVDKKHRFYARRPVPRVGLPVPIGTGTLHARPARAGQGSTRAVPSSDRSAGRWPPTSLPPDRRACPLPEERANLTELHFQLIERCAPPSVMVNATSTATSSICSESVGRFLRAAPAASRPPTSCASVHPDLRMELRGALLQRGGNRRARGSLRRPAWR